MNDPASERLQRRLNRVAWVAVLVLVAVGGLAVVLGRSSGDFARRRVGDQVAEIKAGQRDRIYVSNQVEMAEFVTAARELDESHPFDLSIEYASKVDDFLRQIAGQRGLRGLVLNLTDVSGTGIESAAALPDLERLTINYIGEGLGSSGGWLRYLPPQTLVETLEPLAKSPKLTKLESICATCRPRRSGSCAAGCRTARSPCRTKRNSAAARAAHDACPSAKSRWSKP